MHTNTTVDLTRYDTSIAIKYKVCKLHNFPLGATTHTAAAHGQLLSQEALLTRRYLPIID